MRRLACLLGGASLLRRGRRTRTSDGSAYDEPELLAAPATGSAARRARSRAATASAAFSARSFDALGVRGVEAQVEPEHRHVHEYDAREQNPADRDPEDPAACARLRLLARARGRGRGPRDGLGDRRLSVRQASQPSSPRAAARTARAGCGRPRPPTAGSRGAASPASSAREPQTQIGKSGGHVQPCSCVAQELLDDPVLERVERDHARAGRPGAASRAPPAARARARRARR